MFNSVAASTDRHNLRSATHGDLLVPRTRIITYGPYSSAVSGPCVWNALPLTLHASPGTLRVSKHTEDNTVVLSLWDMIRRFCGCLGH